MSDTSITGTDGDDRLRGDDRGDTIFGLGGDDLLIGGDGRNLMHGGNGHDTIRCGDGADFMFGDAGPDLLIGGGGKDTIEGGLGVDTIDGGGGDDRLFANSRGVGPGPDDSPGERLDGGAGDDLLGAGAGDTALAGSGDDTVFGAGGEGGVFAGGAGRDQLRFTVNGADPYIGDAGFLKDHAFVLDNAQVSGFEFGEIVFGGGNDVVELARHLRGWTLDGGAGDDHLVGAGGADSLLTGAGQDTLEGGGGNDVLTGYGDATGSLLVGGGGDDAIIDYGHGVETLLGGAGKDHLYGHGVLEGGADRDTLEATGVGNLLRGGGGNDFYAFTLPGDGDGVANPSTIRDSTIAQINLSSFDADTNKRGDQQFTLVDAFDGHAGELTIAYDASDHFTHVEGDLDGDGDAEFVLLIKGDHADPGLFVL